jgi:hypothetical protein
VQKKAFYPMGDLWVWCGYPMVGVAVWKDIGREMDSVRYVAGERANLDCVKSGERTESEQRAEGEQRKSG